MAGLLDYLGGLFGGADQSQQQQGLLGQAQTQSPAGPLSPPQITNPLTGATGNQQKWMDALGGFGAALKDAGAYMQHQPEAAGNVAAFNAQRVDRLKDQQMAGMYLSLLPQLIGQQATGGQMFATPPGPDAAAPTASGLGSIPGLSGFTNYGGGQMPQGPQTDDIGSVLSKLPAQVGLPMVLSMIERKIAPNFQKLGPGEGVFDLNRPGSGPLASAPRLPDYGEPQVMKGPDGLPMVVAFDKNGGAPKIYGGLSKPNIDFVGNTAVDKNATVPGTVIPPQPTLGAGYNRNPDGTQSPIPGGPADPRVLASNAAREEAARITAQNNANSPTGPNGNAIGTIGGQAVNALTPGYSTKPIQEAGGITQSAIDQGALEYAITGKLPAGLGNTATGVGGLRKTAIQNRAGELAPGGNLAANGAQLKALQSSLTQQTQYADTTERSVNNAENGFNQVVTAFQGKVNTSNFPVINAMRNATLYHLSPGDISALHAGLTEVSNEYSNVFARGGQVTDAVRQKADAIANGDLSIDALKQVQAELQAQGRIVAGGARSQAQKIQGQFNNILSGGAAPAQSGAVPSIDDLVNKYRTKR